MLEYLSVSLVWLCYLIASSNSQVNPVDPVQIALISLGAQIAGVNQTLQAVIAGLVALRANVTQNSASIATLQTTVAGLRTDLTAAQAQIVKVTADTQTLNHTTYRLGNINKIWSNNFRIVDNTFNQLRKKVTFKVVPGPLVI